MFITEDVKKVIESTSYLAVVTVNRNGKPHPIVVGEGKVSGDTIVFGIYKMETTKANLVADPSAWVVCAAMDDGPKGFRLSGTATPADNQLVFSPSKVEALI